MPTPTPLSSPGLAPDPAAPSSCLGRSRHELSVAGVWRGAEIGRQPSAVVPTGWTQLDRELPGGGWPSRAITEVLIPQPATTEWRLLGPALRRVAARGGSIIAVAPPREPYLPGLQQAGLDECGFVWIEARTLAERLWATEQLIKANACGAIIAWLEQARAEQIRRLQVCAQACEALVFLCRPQAAREQSSAASLRVHASPDPDWALWLRILKRRGPTLDGALILASVPVGLAGLLTPRLLHPSRWFVPEESAHAVGRSAPALRPRRDTAVQ